MLYSLLTGGSGEADIIMIGTLDVFRSIWVEIYVIVALVCCLICMKISATKGESPAWTLCGLFLTIGIIPVIYCDKISMFIKKKFGKPSPVEDNANPVSLETSMKQDDQWEEYFQEEKNKAEEKVADGK